MQLEFPLYTRRVNIYTKIRAGNILWVPFGISIGLLISKEQAFILAHTKILYSKTLLTD